MDQLHLLWDYQQADMEADKMEASIKRSPTRQKLVKYRDYLLEQQNVMKRITGEVAAMADRLEALKDAVAMTENQLKSLQTKIENDPPQDSESTQQFIADVRRFQNNLTTYEQEIRRIRKDAGDRERLQHDVKVRAAKAKGEFDKLKVDYDAEYQEKSKELTALKAVAAEKAKGIEQDLMDRYQNIKRRSVPPLAQLYGDQCGGCNMSLPSAVSRKIKAGELVECETCGRLLIVL
ncbi:MAG: C4-type zinc ribbon domain-containing protein [Eubacteriales bacterium]|nr:C4-type zinc ribbon domain-containing protein [Eubacteriales bacterium]